MQDKSCIFSACRLTLGYAHSGTHSSKLAAELELWPQTPASGTVDKTKHNNGMCHMALWPFGTFCTASASKCSCWAFCCQVAHLAWICCFSSFSCQTLQHLRHHHQHAHHLQGPLAGHYLPQRRHSQHGHSDPEQQTPSRDRLFSSWTSSCFCL